jgi:hypothetical protein
MNANPHDLSAHPDLGPIGARTRSEWAQEQDDAAADAREQFQRHQSFRDWLIAAMHAGDRLAITVVEQRFTGTVEEIGDDLIVCARCSGVDILAPGIPLQIEVEDHPTSGGQRQHRRVVRGPRCGAINADTSIGTGYNPQGLDRLLPGPTS